ncbi:hypothetical protein UFOVP776_47 [uncultured Caudovirales phage]|uniref:Uncharacterized protein n=1 Tax=uncultured Caudovirales phage TaxID=2100421 RepID=A0A6J5NXM0_9CAUD|nr:hypothetical protein UFOVP776_47 [uncultured Caudovirales phage]
MNTCLNCGKMKHSAVMQTCTCLYSMQAPPQRTWVDLTPQDLNDIFKISHTGEGAVYLALKIIKDKNA